MKEIEIKVKINNADEAMSKLGARGCVFSEPIFQDDHVYIENGTKYPVESGKNVLRIRYQKEKILFALKHDIGGNNLAKVEHEFEIMDGEKMDAAIKALGFYEAVRIKKKRQTCKIDDMEICIDEVEGLGSFIEVEKITDQDPEVVQKELLDVLSGLGIDSKERVFQGYDTMLAK